MVFFTLAAFHFVVRPGRRAALLACVCGVLACFSSGNGFLAAPVGFFWLLGCREWRRGVGWTASFCGATAVYLYRYRPFTPPHYDAHVAVWHRVLFFFAFLGSAAENLHHQPVRGGAVMLGLLLFGAIVASWRTGLARAYPFVSLSALWCVLTAMVVAERRIGEGLELGLTLRYKIYSDLLLILCYLYVAGGLLRSGIDFGRKRLVYRVFLALVMLLTTASNVVGYRFLVKRRVRVQEGLNEYAADPARNVPIVSINGDAIPRAETELSRVLLNRAIAEGMYVLPPAEGR